MKIATGILFGLVAVSLSLPVMAKVTKKPPYAHAAQELVIAKKSSKPPVKAHEAQELVLAKKSAKPPVSASESRLSRLA